jgi:hypothetical protein
MISDHPVWPAGAIAARAHAGMSYRPCQQCQRDHYRGADMRTPGAVAEIEAPGMVPAPLAVCGSCLPAYREQYGAALHMRPLGIVAQVTR